jgi:hypothetical protein
MPCGLLNWLPTFRRSVLRASSGRSHNRTKQIGSSETSELLGSRHGGMSEKTEVFMNVVASLFHESCKNGLMSLSSKVCPTLSFTVAPVYGTNLVTNH